MANIVGTFSQEGTALLSCVAGPARLLPFPRSFLNLSVDGCAFGLVNGGTASLGPVFHVRQLGETAAVQAGVNAPPGVEFNAVRRIGHQHTGFASPGSLATTSVTAVSGK